jgi:Flp pilus assembly protein TadG
MGRSFLRRISGEDGAQILEFALAVPLLVVFVVGIFDFGQAYNVKVKLNSAAKDGARFGATQPTNDLSNTVPPTVAAIRDLVDADLTAAGINDCALGPILHSSALIWTATGTCAGNTTFTLTIDRGFVYSTSSPAVQVVATHVDLNYPFQWHFNSVITLLVSSASYAGSTQIDTDAIAANQD